MIAYVDCFSGVSGDMLLAGLLDAGLDPDRLRQELRRVPLGGYTLEVQRVSQHGLTGTSVRVVVAEPASPERHLADILALVEQSALAEPVKEKVQRVFRLLAEAEATVHGTTPERVHFHEVGAVDSMVDIIGVCLGLDLLGVRAVYASPLPAGGGQVQTAHGLLPVPAPAVLEICRRVGAPLLPSAARTELVTPTGAALLGALATFAQPALRLRAVGYGFGQKTLPWPNCLRLWLGEPLDPGLDCERLAVLETNIDDATPEMLGAAMERLLAEGALDVFFTPIQMKKNRPATKVSVIAPPPLAAHLAAVLIAQTTTLGVRVFTAERYRAQRWTATVETPWGPVRVKVRDLFGQRQASPEYEDCLRLARAHDRPLAEVYAAVVAAARAAGLVTP